MAAAARFADSPRRSVKPGGVRPGVAHQVGGKTERSFPAESSDVAKLRRSMCGDTFPSPARAPSTCTRIPMARRLGYVLSKYRLSGLWTLTDVDERFP